MASSIFMLLIESDGNKSHRLRQAGGLLSATIPAEMARRFHLSPGDRIEAIETEQAILLSPFDPAVEEALALASAAALERRGTAHHPATGSGLRGGDRAGTPVQ
jgi:bifunctional DNA-binding transcriptional regulator/antitoxin component of YhaV-PrlF toxin-antitoxin module